MSEHADSTTADPLSYERLAVIEQGLAPWDPALSGRDWVKQAACELLAEVSRLAAVEAKLRGHLDAIGVAHREGMVARRRVDEIRDQEEVELRARAKTAEAAWSAQQDIIEAERRRAETAERELAEMRGRIGEATVAWAPGDKYGPFTNTAYTETVARGQLAAGQRAWWRVVGEWKAADHGQ